MNAASTPRHTTLLRPMGWFELRDRKPIDGDEAVLRTHDAWARYDACERERRSTVRRAIVLLVLLIGIALEYWFL